MNISMEHAETKCCQTKFSSLNKAGRANGSMSFLSTVLLILIPKCPLCLTAYMSAAVMFFDIENEQLVPFLLHAKPVLGMLIILMILLNRRGKRTWISLAIAAAAMVLLVLKTYYATFLVPDWVLYAAFIAAIWYNGNFMYFYRFIRFGRTREAVS